MPGQSLQAHAHIDESVHPLILFIGTAHLRIHLQRLLQGDTQLRRHHLGNGIHKSIGQVHDSSHIPQHAFGRQGTEGDDLHHLVFPIFAGHIVDDLLPSLKAEIHVNIGHGYTLRIQEPLEKQLIPDRIDVSDLQTVGYDGAGRGTSARSYTDAMLSGIVDIIPDDQEVVHIAHIPDNAQLILQAPAKGAVILRIPLLHAVVAELI